MKTAKKIDIQNLFSALDREMKLKLSSNIDEIHHSGTKGTESELNWIGLLNRYLPERYKVSSGFVVDHKGNLSDQIDVIIYDRHFTPFIFHGENVVYIPAEGVYGVFEVRPEFSKQNYDYAVTKLESVRTLERTSANFVHISGSDKKQVFDIIGGILTATNSSNEQFKAIDTQTDLSVVVCLEAGVKVIYKEKVESNNNSNILSFFLLKIIERLRALGSVPALEVDKYLGIDE
jgi:hypothetical protein